MLSPKEVRAAMLRKLKESGLNEKDATLLGYAPYTQEQATKKKLQLSLLLAGFLIPYYSPLGDPLDFHRYRYLEQPETTGFAALTERKPIRYSQPPGEGPYVYFPLNYDWKKFFLLAPEKRRLFITEGELKTACMAKLGIPAVGLGGVWNFKTKTRPLTEDMEEIPWDGMQVYICYDSDAVTNVDVIKAENFLARQLTDRKAFVNVIRLPALEPGKKTGVDDFLVAEGVEEFNKLVDESEPWLAGSILHWLNEQVAYIINPGTIYRWNNDQRITPADFKNHAYSTYKLIVEVPKEGGMVKKETSAPDAWLKWPGRAELTRTTYKPGQSRITAERELNVWQSWGLPEAVLVKGDTALWDELINFLFKYAEDKSIKEWFLSWLAYPLQHPGTKLFTSVVLWGLAQGTGKTLVGHTMQRIYGRNFIEIGNRQLESNFNDWAVGKQFVLGDEIAGGDKRNIADYMKSLITQQEVTINAKHEKLYTIPDCINYLFTSNHPDSVFLEDADRRYFVHEIRGTPLSPAFYKAYDAWYRSAAVGALFHNLFTRSTGEFAPRGHAPMTTAKRTLISTGRSDHGTYIAGLHDGATQLTLAGKPMGITLWTTTEIHRSYVREEPNTRLSVNGLGKELMRAGFRKVLEGANIKTATGAQNLWALGPRAEEALAISNPKKIADWYNAERGLVNGSGEPKKAKY